MPTDLSAAFYISYVALWALVILHSLLLLGVVRMVYQLHRAGGVTGRAARSDTVGLKSGQVAPTFNAMDISGTPISSTDFAGRVVALAFISPSCRSCVMTLDDMKVLNNKTQGNVIAICQAEREECSQLVEQHQLKIRTIVDEDAYLKRLFGIQTYPTVVLIDNNRIKSFGQPERGEIENMFEEATRMEPEADVKTQEIREVAR